MDMNFGEENSVETSVVFFGSPARDFVVGDIVVNFGHTARVVEVIDSNSIVVREIGKRTQWVADPAKCARAI